MKQRPVTYPSTPVNNVGTNHDIPTPFDEESDKVIADIVEVNIKGALKMTKLVLPQMRKK